MMEIIMPIEQILKKNMFTRISKEMSELYNKYDNIHIQYCHQTNMHTIKMQDQQGIYIFSLNQHYPFSPPKSILVNNIPFFKFCEITSPRFLHYIQLFANELQELLTPYGSIALRQNWGPANTVIQVMREIKNTQELKRRLVLYSLLDTIGTKYGIPEDIRIQDFL